ncbi:phage tail domain-containing protein [Paenibacillus sp. FSL R7-0302]|uniref:phage tail domain-containing protein n=1 Tax=Paenibacillus sp. FSL R7-0302 TaxID=2921681 RepID=UPI0030FAD70C
MPIMESVAFSYDGKYSNDFGIVNITADSGMYKEQYLASRSIIEQTIAGNPKPYFNRIEYEPIALSLTFAFENGWDDKKYREVARWLGNQEYYKPLFFAENPTRIFYCMLSDEPELVHNGNKQGYITLNMRCDSPYTYSPIMVSKKLDYSNNVSGATYTIANDGDLICKPEIFIKKIGVGDISIVNTTNKNKEFKFVGLANNEIVYIDNEREHIETDVPLTYRYSNFNNNYLELVRGINTLTITGKAIISFRYQFKTLG